MSRAKPFTFNRVARASGRRHQHGLTLIELLVAMGLGLILVVGIGTVYLGSRQTYRMQEANARVQETGRFALEVIGRSLRQAGADGNLTAWTNPQPGEESCLERNDPVYKALERPCTLVGAACQLNANAKTPGGTTCGLVGGVCVPVNRACFALQGEDGAAAADVFAVQFYAGPQGDRTCDTTQAVAGDVITNVFSLNGNNLQCTSRVDLLAGGSATPPPQPLVSEIEDLRIIYGVDTDANQSADIYTATPAVVQWPDVVTAKVCVMVRSVEQGLAAVTQRPLDCLHALDTELALAGTPIPPSGDTRLHRAFVATFNLRNRITNTP